MYFDYKGIRLYYEKYGSGDIELVILPGWGDTRESFNYLIRTLEDYYTIYIIDYPGFGKTNFPSYDMTIYDYTDMINEWIKVLNLKNPTLLGHSFGGRIIITLCGYYKYKFDKTILMNAAGIKPKKTLKSRFKTFIYKFLKKTTKILPMKIRKKAISKLFNYFASDDYKKLPNNMRKTFQNVVGEDLKSYLKNIVSDTLIIWGNEDKATPVNDAIIMNEQIRHSKLYVYMNAGHFVYLDRFQEILETIVKFIEN